MDIPRLTQRPSSYNSASHEEKAIPPPLAETPPLEKTLPTNKYVLWAKVLWPLALHACLAIIIATVMIHSVDHHSFNLDEHQPQVKLADGTTTRSKRYAPLQSEVTTLLSAALAVHRMIGAAWLRPLVWRCAFIIMEAPGGGLKPGQLHRMVNFGLPALSRKGGLVIWLILAAVLPVHIVSPVLTGSITWAPYYQRMEQPPSSIISVPAVKVLEQETGRANFRELVSMRAVGRANVAWERGSQNGAMKRVLPSAADLEINSTLSTVTLPYFSVAKVDWIQDPTKSLAPDQLDLQIICSRIVLTNLSTCPIAEIGTIALIPDTLPDPNLTLLPSPLPVSETRLMILAASVTGRDGLCHSLPGLNPYPPSAPEANVFCWAFARVTYTVGVGTCTNCRMSSYSTVQNDTELSVMGDPLTPEALFMMPTVINMMVSMNNPNFTLQGDADEHVVKLLSRSYGASWAALADIIDTGPLNTTYSAALPSSQALVSLIRVYVWLGIHLLVTVSGVIFIFVQVRATDPVILDAALAAFYLDIGDVSAKHPELREGPLRKIHYDGGHLKVDVNPR